VVCSKHQISRLGKNLLYIGAYGKWHIHSMTTGARVIPQLMGAKNAWCDSPEQSRTGAYSVTISAPGGGKVSGLVTPKGPRTPFHFTSLGCFHHGLAPFTIAKKKPPAKP
jgi:hypothetical protein